MINTHIYDQFKCEKKNSKPEASVGLGESVTIILIEEVGSGGEEPNKRCSYTSIDCLSEVMHSSVQPPTYQLSYSSSYMLLLVSESTDAQLILHRHSHRTKWHV